MNTNELTQEALKVLKLNDLGRSTRPTAKLYPHQWLWDSAFIAIGLRHVNIRRAQEEIRSLLESQWKNGMIPYIIFGEAKEYHAGPTFWQSHVSSNCPEGIQSTGGTQPPMIAEAVVRIGQLLPEKDRKAWYKEVYPRLAAYHEWLYRDRDPEGTGLPVLFHPWETGLDNNPAWMKALHEHAVSYRLRLMDKSQSLTKFIERFRKDTSVVPANERMSTLELFAFYDLVRAMRRLHYDDQKLFKKHKLVIQARRIDIEAAVNNITITGMRDALPFDHTEAQLKTFLTTHVPPIVLAATRCIAFEPIEQEENTGRKVTGQCEWVEELGGYKISISDKIAHEFYNSSLSLFKDEPLAYRIAVGKAQQEVHETMVHELGHVAHTVLPIASLQQWQKHTTTDTLSLTGYIRHCRDEGNQIRLAREDLTDTMALFTTMPEVVRIGSAVRFSAMNEIYWTFMPNYEIELLPKISQRLVSARNIFNGTDEEFIDYIKRSYLSHETSGA